MPAHAATVAGQSSVTIDIGIPTDQGSTTHVGSGATKTYYGASLKVYGFSQTYDEGTWWMATMGGSVYLQRQLPGGPWVDIAGPEPGGGQFPNLATTMGTASYRTRFTGGQVSVGTTTTTYPAAYSPVVTVAVTRRVVGKHPVLRGHRIVTTVKVVPSLAKHKIKIQVKHGKHWRRYAKVRLDKHSAARLGFRASAHGVRYRFLLPKDAHFAASRFPLTARLG
jgi:hypothetical protein